MDNSDFWTIFSNINARRWTRILRTLSPSGRAALKDLARRARAELDANYSHGDAPACGRLFVLADALETLAAEIPPAELETGAQRHTHPNGRPN